MKKISIVFILFINIFLYQSLFSQGLVDLFKSRDDLSNFCKSTKIRKGKYLVTTAKWCKFDGVRIEKIVTYQDLKWNDLIKVECFDATHADGSKLKKSIITYQNEKIVKGIVFDYTFADGSKYKNSINTYENDKKVKEEWFDYTYANGDKYKKKIDTYQNGNKVKEEWFDYTYADGDKIKRSIDTYEDGERVKEEFFDFYIKKENKSFDIVNREENRSTCLYEYYHKDKIIKTKPLDDY